MEQIHIDDATYYYTKYLQFILHFYLYFSLITAASARLNSGILEREIFNSSPFDSFITPSDFNLTTWFKFTI